ncbi:uncharacterized protein LOC142521915 [Primulina tabacum]|uniref:uncharacterized protein LOC142521915 n=1 Tax=Primulina tabacum TaxID=48773 RepID=UPI003F590C5E
MARTESHLDSMETHMGNMGATMKSLETQIGQLANALRDQNKGQFPSNTEVNPKEQCKAVTLRSGKKIGILEPAEENVEILVEEDDGNAQHLTKVELPYPQRFKKKGLDDQFAKFLEIFKKIHINISFADALEQMANYAKLVKDVMSKKRKLQEFETVKLTEECSAILQRKLPQKLKDPGSFTIPCVIGGSKDLGAWRDMEEDQETLVIFGRPFLATGKSLIDVHKGELTLRVGGDEVVFNIYNTIRGPNEVSTCNSIDIIDSCVSQVGAGRLTKDSLERCLLESASIVDEEEWDVREELIALNMLPKEKVYAKHEELLEDASKEKSYSPYVDHQRRLNPAMKEVVRAEERSLPPPFIDQMLDRVGGYHYYCFLDGYSSYNQIVIAPEDQEKTTFTCPYDTFFFRRMPFGLCNAPAMFQRCMMDIFSDMVEENMEVFMDDISIFGSSFDHFLQNLTLVLQRCRAKKSSFELGEMSLHGSRRNFAWAQDFS